jgi:hypothetical protein
MVSAQAPFSLVEGQSAIVYSLPKTEFCIEIQSEKVSQKQGVFYRYSERYLATNKIIAEDKTTYRLKSISVSTRAIPDQKRTFNVIPNKELCNSNIAVNSAGLLCGVNVSSQTDVLPSKSIIFPTINYSSPALLPLGEEYMMAGSEAKLAEGAAKQIYRIRESRLGLLTSDLEKVPADGASFKSMLDGLTKLETELTELFIGKTSTELQVQNIIITPDSALVNHVLFRFSGLKGVVASNDLSGVPYFISFKPTTINSTSPDAKVKTEKAGIFTLLPASTLVTIDDGVNEYFSNQYFVPQFGKLIPIAENLFKKNKLKVQVDVKTGRLLSIE